MKNEIKRNPKFFMSLLAIILTLAGLGLSFYSKDPLFLNRCGALLIVIGVLYGLSSYKRDRLAVNDKLHELRTTILQQNTRECTEEAKIGIPEDLRTLRLGPKQKKIDGMKRKTIAKLQFIEIWIVCGGTILNGWGDFILRKALPQFFQ